MGIGYEVSVQFQGKIEDMGRVFTNTQMSVFSSEKSVKNVQMFRCTGIGVDSGGGQRGRAPPIIKMGQNPFLPPNNQKRISKKFLPPRIR